MLADIATLVHLRKLKTDICPVQPLTEIPVSTNVAKYRRDVDEQLFELESIYGSELGNFRLDCELANLSMIIDAHTTVLQRILERKNTVVLDASDQEILKLCGDSATEKRNTKSRVYEYFCNRVELTDLPQKEGKS